MHSEYPDNPNTELPLDNQRLPVSLQIIAYLAVLGGAMGSLEMVLHFVNGRGSFNLYFLLLPAGWAIFQLREWGRSLVAFFTILAGIGCVLVMVMQILSFFPWAVHGEHLFEPAWGSYIGMMLLCIVIFAYVVWQFRALNRPDIVELFKNARNRPRPIFPIRFSVANLLVLFVLAAFVMMSVLDKRRYSTLHTMTSSTFSTVLDSGELQTIQYGYAISKYDANKTVLNYVFFDTGPNEDRGIVSVQHIGGKRGTEVSLFLPDGETIYLNQDQGLFEKHQGQLRRSDARITYEKLQAFLADPDAERSLDRLLDFVEELRNAAP